MLQLSVYWVNLYKPVMLSLRFAGACSVLGLCGWSLVSYAIDAVNRAKIMHQIPCTKCRFFTGDYRLKCTINPHVANTEAAIGCNDYYKREGKT